MAGADNESRSAGLQDERPVILRRDQILNHEEKVMKPFQIAILISLALLVSACAPAVNSPADVEAIRNMYAGMEKADAEKNIDWFMSTYFADGAVRMPPNAPQQVGKEAIQSAIELGSDQFDSSRLTISVEEVLSLGDMAAARGAYTWAGTPRATGLGEMRDDGKWSATLRRQADGSWKCVHEIWNSNLPAPGATADGAQEAALFQIEREWEEAALKNDAAWLDKTLADEWMGRNPDGQVQSKRQAVAEMRSGAVKIESGAISDMTAVVFGDTAIVRGAWTEKSTTRGKDTSGNFRWTDVFVKRDGSWVCISSHTAKVE
ncbi:MAG: DUF4440 domain-containing protein [Acidobacteriota bacterium]